jgi:hypothetical protein
VVCDAEVGDISGWHDTSTGRFTPQVAGWYRFSWCVTMGGLASGNTVVTDLRLNAAGEAHGQSATQPAAGVNACSVGSANCPANGTTDFFDILLTHTGVGSQAITTGRANTYFCAELIGRS